MSVNAASEIIDQTFETPDETPEWVPSPPPTDLIFDDGEPLESNRHRIAMNVLIRSLKHAWSEGQNYFTGGNMFVYYSRQQAKNRDFRGPDFFVVLDVESNPARQGWVVWDEEGRYPDVIVELLSESTAQVDKGLKKELYRRVFKTRDYLIFDPFDENSLLGWKLDERLQYASLTPNQHGWLWSETLGLWLGTWEGKVEDDTATWLRFYDADENLVLLPEEAERQRADTERQQAEMERQRADTERQRADTERQRADTERQRAERLTARLRELGETV